MLRIYFAMALVLALSSAGCMNGPVPRWDGKLYTGSQADFGIVRKQAANPQERVIRGDDPRINNFMAMPWKGPQGFEGFYDTYVLGCEKWRAGMKMSTLEAEVRKIYKSAGM